MVMPVHDGHVHQCEVIPPIVYKRAPASRCLVRGHQNETHGAIQGIIIHLLKVNMEAVVPE